MNDPLRNATAATGIPDAESFTLGRLRWRCRRGMKELDVLLERFAQQLLPQAGVADCRVFSELLDLSLIHI